MDIRKPRESVGARPSRRDSLRLIAAALAAPALFSAAARGQDAGAADKTGPAAAPPGEAATLPGDGGALGPAAGAGTAGLWPSEATLLQGNAANLAALKKVALANGDAPDTLPHPPLPGAQSGSHAKARR